jgi:hypothetical protein
MTKKLDTTATLADAGITQGARIVVVLPASSTTGNAASEAGSPAGNAEALEVAALLEETRRLHREMNAEVDDGIRSFTSIMSPTAVA